MKQLKLAFAALLTLPLMAACNTINGMGEDVQAIGRGVSSAATYVERELFYADTTPSNRQIAYRNVTVGEACDPDPDLAGGSNLPPCRSRTARPTPANH